MPWEGPQWWTPISHHRGGDLPPSRFGPFGLRTAAAGCSLFAARRFKRNRLCTWRNGRILHSCKIESSNTQHRPVPSPARHQARTMICLGRGAGGFVPRPRRTARTAVATVGRCRAAARSRSPMTSAHVPSHPGRLNNMECAILPHFRQPSAAVDYRVRVRIMIRRHNDRVREAYLSRISRL